MVLQPPQNECMARNRVHGDEREERETHYLRTIEPPEYLRAAELQATAMREESDPKIYRSDLAAGTRYLRTCMDNMTLSEVQYRDDQVFVALWARGALGAARYRAAKAKQR